MRLRLLALLVLGLTARMVLAGTSIESKDD